jgi:uncharacterized protein (DUF362 family)
MLNLPGFQPLLDVSRLRSSRRAFLKLGLTGAAAAPWLGGLDLLAAGRRRSDAKVAIASCRGYGPEVKTSMARCFDMLGGLGSLVKGKSVAVKINLTGTDFRPVLSRPVGETYMTHFSTALALASLAFEAGARRVRFVESTGSRAALESTLGFADWDVRVLQGLGDVQFENTRNLGLGTRYAHLKVPGAGYLFSSFDLNRSYEDTDVLVSLCKLKQHVTAGVTLSMKNMFGITPNTLYGDEAGTEDATGGRGPMHGGHDSWGHGAGRKISLPGFKNDPSNDPTYRVPRIIADLCLARPVHLAVIDAITAMSGGEGPWCGDANSLKVTRPGLMIAGLNPVSTDAVGVALMGYGDPRAPRGTEPFEFCDNHLLLAEQAGAGTADLARIEVLGLPIRKAIWKYDRLVAGG